MMKTADTIKEVRNILDGHRGKSVALVPTMGALHEGHMALVEAARKKGDIVAVSIFVNPLQFGPDEDLDSYPRNLERDLEICRAHGVDVVFHPSEAEMYPKMPELELHLRTMASILDGVRRPGHFEGVVTVVNKLFNIIRPDFAVFGEKDRQQLMIIRRMVEDFNHDIEIVGVPTEREADGLAKSSRNVNLSDTERAEAPEINRALEMGRDMIREGVSDAGEVKERIEAHVEDHASGMIDDLQIFTHPDLNPVQNIDGDVIIFIAVKFERTRLIDNMMVIKNDQDNDER
ncbi:pantoate--beta-alanine ligase [Salinicoccus roseus]|uniref:Pantothenate synthetase n=1 Tax=Salinicoccus roseus TaxID=45670 RepID=A0A0C2HH60_9STAP|nr:pantoate--beta-alanine ligase [Salinicoccus roseus]KIH70979.1 pantoate--beta-alanine ligase [Salinicoccus roseus]MDB0580206.1 pantoate--beta-alanine ligase [Salinicoccus roseus]